MNKKINLDLVKIPCSSCDLLINDRTCGRGSEEFPQTDACQRLLEWCSDFKRWLTDLIPYRTGSFVGEFKDAPLDSELMLMFSFKLMKEITNKISIKEI